MLTDLVYIFIYPSLSSIGILFSLFTQDILWLTCQVFQPTLWSVSSWVALRWHCGMKCRTSTSIAVMGPGCLDSCSQQVSPYCWKKVAAAILAEAQLRYPNVNYLLHFSFKLPILNTTKILTLSKLPPCSGLTTCTCCDTSLPTLPFLQCSKKWVMSDHSVSSTYVALQSSHEKW